MSGSEVLRITGGVLVGAEDVRAEMWVVGGRITFTPPVGLPGGADASTVRGWVLPGLVDAHCHVGLGTAGAVDDTTSEQQAVTDRSVGGLLLRDAGSPADTRWIDDREDLPKLVRAGRHIARTRRYIRGFAHEIEPEDLADHVVREARRGDGWVKLVGDWIDRSQGDLAPCWPRGALRDAVAAAHAEGARVTAHCFAESCLPDLVQTGIDCVEHATGLSEQTIPMFAEHQVPIVPTLVNTATFPDIADQAEAKFPAYAKHMRNLHARRYATVASAHEAGIPIYVGTDAGSSVPHGLVAAEVAELVRAGLPPVEALSAATWGARDWLGFDGLVEGAEADLVVYPEDPRTDVGVLQTPSLVVLRGRVVKGTTAT